MSLASVRGKIEKIIQIGDLHKFGFLVVTARRGGWEDLRAGRHFLKSPLSTPSRLPWPWWSVQHPEKDFLEPLAAE